MFTTAPAKMPVAAPFEAPAYQVPRAPLVPPPLDPNMPGGPGSGPTRMPHALATPPSFPPPGAPAVTGPPWAATVPLNAPRERPGRGGEHLVGTMRLTRRSDRQVMFSKLVLPMALLVVVGMLVGGYVAMHGERSRAPHPVARPAAPEVAAPAVAVVAAPAPIAAPIVAPAPAPTVAAVPAPASAPTVTPAANLVDVRIDSNPSGATVTLVDRGKTQLVGNTPISASFDPSREYDLVFSYPNKPTKVEHVNLANTRRVSVVLH